jgi:hypothetical protein
MCNYNIDERTYVNEQQNNSGCSQMLVIALWQTHWRKKKSAESGVQKNKKETEIKPKKTTLKWSCQKKKKKNPGFVPSKKNNIFLKWKPGFLKTRVADCY